jgi:hypothetical protein
MPLAPAEQIDKVEKLLKRNFHQVPEILHRLLGLLNETEQLVLRSLWRETAGIGGPRRVWIPINQVKFAAANLRHENTVAAALRVLCSGGTESILESSYFHELDPDAKAATGGKIKNHQKVYRVCVEHLDAEFRRRREAARQKASIEQGSEKPQERRPRGRRYPAAQASVLTTEGETLTIPQLADRAGVTIQDDIVFESLESTSSEEKATVHGGKPEPDTILKELEPVFLTWQEELKTPLPPKARKQVEQLAKLGHPPEWLAAEMIEALRAGRVKSWGLLIEAIAPAHLQTDQAKRDDFWVAIAAKKVEQFGEEARRAADEQIAEAERRTQTERDRIEEEMAREYLARNPDQAMEMRRRIRFEITAKRPTLTRDLLERETEIALLPAAAKAARAAAS